MIVVLVDGLARRFGLDFVKECKMANSAKIHPTSDVQSADIGAGTSIWQFCVVLAGAKIGADCNICSHCFIENDVIIGDRVTIKCGVALWDGVRVEDGVFIGPNVTFCNDKYPRSKNKQFKCESVIIKKGASVGAAAVILPGVTIGENALIAAGSVVTRDVPPNSIFIKGEVKPMTNPAQNLEGGGFYRLIIALYAAALWRCVAVAQIERLRFGCALYKVNFNQIQRRKNANYFARRHRGVACRAVALDGRGF